MKKRSLIAASLGLASLCALLPLQALAQAFPSKPIRIIVPFTPGSATDTMGRIISERLSVALGQPVTIENRAGAGGTIGMNVVAKAPPDGYTLGVISSGHVVNPVLYASIPYDTLKDFAGVAPLASLIWSLRPKPSLAPLTTQRQAWAVALTSALKNSAWLPALMPCMCPSEAHLNR